MYVKQEKCGVCGNIVPTLLEVNLYYLDCGLVCKKCFCEDPEIIKQFEQVKKDLGLIN